MRVIVTGLLLLAGLTSPVEALTEAEAAAAWCDEMAASPIDPQKPKNRPGVPFDDIVAEKAVAACASATGLVKNNARLLYQYGRALGKAGRDKESAAAYEAASAKGSIAASYNASILFKDGGQGLTIDTVKALAFLEKAAEGGLPNAMLRLGLAYDEGDGAIVNKGKAVYWYGLAAKAGLTEGETWAADIFDEQTGITLDDPEQAAEIWRRLSGRGDSDAQLKLATRIWEGKVKPLSATEPQTLLEKSATAGNRQAAWNLAKAFSTGTQLPRSSLDAVKWAYRAFDIAVVAKDDDSNSWPLYQKDAAKLIIGKISAGEATARDKREYEDWKANFAGPTVEYKINVKCGDKRIDQNFYVWDWSRDYSPLSAQFVYLEKVSGCNVPQEVIKSLDEMFVHSKMQNLSFVTYFETKYNERKDTPAQKKPPSDEEIKAFSEAVATMMAPKWQILTAKETAGNVHCAARIDSPDASILLAVRDHKEREIIFSVWFPQKSGIESSIGHADLNIKFSSNNKSKALAIPGYFGSGSTPGSDRKSTQGSHFGAALHIVSLLKGKKAYFNSMWQLLDGLTIENDKSDPKFQIMWGSEWKSVDKPTGDAGKKWAECLASIR